MMDPAYFVGKNEVLAFVNDKLQLNLTKVEQTCTGAVACQLTDRLFPKTVAMNRVHWTANKDYEYIANYKLLQTAWDKSHVTKQIPVDRLINGRFQDNLEFLQWFVKFYQMNDSGEDANYDAVMRRNKGKGGSEYSTKYKYAGNSGLKTSGNSATARRLAKQKSATTLGTKTPPPSRTKSRVGSTQPATGSSNNKAASETLTAKNEELQRKIEVLNKDNEGMTHENGELRVTIDGLEKERDFYFGKLRDVEILLQQLIEPSEEDMAANGAVTEDVKKLGERILGILYATDDEATTGEEQTADNNNLQNEQKEEMQEDFSKADLKSQNPELEDTPMTDKVDSFAEHKQDDPMETREEF